MTTDSKSPSSKSAIFHIPHSLAQCIRRPWHRHHLRAYQDLCRDERSAYQTRLLQAHRPRRGRYDDPGRTIRSTTGGRAVDMQRPLLHNLQPREQDHPCRPVPLYSLQTFAPSHDRGGETPADGHQDRESQHHEGWEGGAPGTLQRGHATRPQQNCGEYLHTCTGNPHPELVVNSMMTDKFGTCYQSELNSV